ncbi:hypothetical protein [Flavisolibacter tropicus]|uniref:Uncharacterized protein n=1 Tax=Flavisolibacter tropicus TaxID=1492898 RepID=A0A172TXT3_9BACT|nr:hypothetical protein [Flavisolibacter tropicus]ANE51583.1 hypothetical protein SY85_14790 [Flavisolibacter tropicus]
MNYRNFNTLEELEQADTAWNNGTLLAERFESFHCIQLYQLEDYYIEVTRHQHFNVILKVTSFKDTAPLEPYLKAINIDALFSE